METTISISPAFDREAKVHPKGWQPLDIEYGTIVHGGVSFLCWKIKNTEHVFRIHTKIVLENHGTAFSEHFSRTLEVFLEDFREWEAQGFPEEWMKRYRDMYQHLMT